MYQSAKNFCKKLPLPIVEVGHNDVMIGKVFLADVPIVEMWSGALSLGVLQIGKSELVILRVEGPQHLCEEFNCENYKGFGPAPPTSHSSYLNRISFFI